MLRRFIGGDIKTVSKKELSSDSNISLDIPFRDASCGLSTWHNNRLFFFFEFAYAVWKCPRSGGGKAHANTDLASINAQVNVNRYSDEYLPFKLYSRAINKAGLVP